MDERAGGRLAAPNARLIVFFLALSFLCMGAHELIHHLATRCVCGAWGTMTLSQFFLPPGCETSPWWLATLAGPVLTYVLIWSGMAMRSEFGLLLVFANLPLARAVTVAMRGGDEMVLGRLFIGDAAAWPVVLVISALLLLPPLIWAWRQFPPAGRWWRFVAWLLLPLLWDFVFKRMLLNRALPLLPEQAGVPAVIFIFYAAALAILFAAWRRGSTDRQGESAWQG